MSIISNDEQFNFILNKCKIYYESTFHIDLSHLKVFLSDDLPVEYKLFSDDGFIPKNDNGIYIFPNTINNSHIALMNYDPKREDISLSSTIFHEYTHYCDYTKFASEYCDNNWTSIRENYLFPVFYYWSEYHARIIQLIHMRKFASLIKPHYVYTIDLIKDEMVNFQLPRYNEELSDSIAKETFAIPDIFKYCGRIYVCNFYGCEINIMDVVPKEILRYFPDIEKLYNDLSLMQTYEEASMRLFEIREKIDSFL